MEMVFQFAEGSRLNGNPQTVGEELHRIRAARKHLTAADVLETAGVKTNALHRYFEWNDKAAAEQYRLDQARHLIRSIVVIETDDHGEIRPIRAFAKIRVDDENTYEAIEVVIADPALRRRVLEEVRRDIERLKQKLSALSGFSDLMGALNQVDIIVTNKLREDRASV